MSSSRRLRTTWEFSIGRTTTAGPRPEYLAWTGTWVAAVARVLAPHGSLFMNVGSKPTEPWTALDVAQAARQHLQLQNLIHWIKSITVDAEAAGVRSGLTADLSVGSLQANQLGSFSPRLPGVCLPLLPRRPHPARSSRPWGQVSGCVQRRAVAACRRRTALPGQCLVHPLRNDSEPGSRPAAPRHVPPETARILRAASRPRPDGGRDGPVSRARQHRGRRGAAQGGLRRHRARRALPAGGHRANEVGVRRRVERVCGWSAQREHTEWPPAPGPFPTPPTRPAHRPVPTRPHAPSVLHSKPLEAISAPHISFCTRGARLGPTTAGNHPGDRRDRFIHRGRTQTPRVPVGHQPADSPARR